MRRQNLQYFAIKVPKKGDFVPFLAVFSPQFSSDFIDYKGVVAGNRPKKGEGGGGG
jgi:hypothetical protein